MNKNINIFKLIKGKNIALISAQRYIDIKDNITVDAVLINDIINDLNLQGYNTKYFFQGDFYPNNILMNKYYKIKSDNSKKQKPRPVLSYIFFILTTLISDLSLKFKHEIYRRLKEFDTIIVISPAMVGPIRHVFKKNKIIILYELNIEYKLLEFNLNKINLNKISILSKIIIKIVKLWEIRAIALSDIIACASPRDAKVLATEFNKKIIVYYYPDIKIKKFESIKRPVQITNILTNKQKIINDCDFIITFIGSCSIVNCYALNEIIKINKKLNDEHIIFLMIGSIGNCWCVNNNIPDNIIFCGIVKNLINILPVSNVFILFDKQPTGIEGKIRTYKEYNKPVIGIGKEVKLNYFPFLGELLLACNNDEDAVKKIESLKHNSVQKFCL
ncbi:MAG: hypothetical protein RXO36_05570 [Candidatus Nanopusillus acidilobi]